MHPVAARIQVDGPEDHLREVLRVHSPVVQVQDKIVQSGCRHVEWAIVAA